MILRITAIAAFAFLVGSGSAKAAFFSFKPDVCQLRNQAVVAVEVVAPSYVVDHSLDHDEIMRLATAGNIFFGTNQYAPGLTTAEIMSSANYQMNSWELKDGLWCSVIEKIDVSLSLRKPATVYIEKALPNTSCAYGAVLKHEMKHVATYGRTIYEGRARVIAVVEALLARTPPVGVAADLEGSRAAVTATIQPLVNLSVSDVMRFSQAMNNAIDTKEEYTRVQASCQDW